MPTKTEIIEAGARAIHEDQCSSPDEVCNPDCFRAKELSEAALTAMLPLILKALEDAADAMDADPAFRDPLRLRADWLRTRAEKERESND